MKKIMKREYIEKIYAGWLAKIIGVRMGAPIEGWSYEKIREFYGELKGYPVEYKQFAADDDTNGPLFFLRALGDSTHGVDITPQDIGEALLNYACYEEGFFWWGGYGVSTEHTAYLNLRAGIKAPDSGSAAKNGSAVAEQIGGQIFIDTWGLVTPGNPDLAAVYARKAASVTHDGNGIYGGIFVASCISYAFTEQDIVKIIEKGLSYLPEDCEYTRVVREVMAFWKNEPADWRACFAYIQKNFGYDKYPGTCHIIPNSAVMILALLYGNGDFADTLNICNMCGWDTDCNVGNVATIMGVRCGLAAIDGALRRPVNDVLICSSTIGSLNIQDIPSSADYIVRLAAKLADEELPSPWKEILSRKNKGCHFEYPGSTHGMRVRAEGAGFLVNTNETAYSGDRCLKIEGSVWKSSEIFLYRKTYYLPDDFDDSRYNPSFSPTLYPGQRISGMLKMAEAGAKGMARAYVKNIRTGEMIFAEKGVILDAEEWKEVSMDIPGIENGLLGEAGFAIENVSGAGDICVYLDDFYQEGTPDYTIDFKENGLEVWKTMRKEVSQFTKMKGLTWIEKGKLHLSGADFGEIYTGGSDWEDYQASFTICPEFGSCCMVNVRVQGAIRSYAAGFQTEGKLGFYKNENGYRALAEIPFAWEKGKEYIIAVKAEGNRFEVKADGVTMLKVVDEENPYLYGGIGLSVRNGGHVSCKRIEVTK